MDFTRLVLKSLMSYTNMTCVLFVLQLSILEKFRHEYVIVCSLTWISSPSNRDTFTMYEYNWLMLEVNMFWTRANTTLSGSDKRNKIPSISKYCNQDMVDKA